MRYHIDSETGEFLYETEDKILEKLLDHEGCLYIGRQTANNTRKIFFACKDFRKPSKVLHQFTLDNPGATISFDIYKDKYWRSFNRFKQN